MTCAVGESCQESDYQTLRSELIGIEDRNIASRLPRFVKTCRNLKEFEQFIYEKSRGQPRKYEVRRQFLAEAFDPLLHYLEGVEESPVDDATLEALNELNAEHITEDWRTALARRNAGDLKGAITIARTMLDSVCKFILDQARIKYESSYKFPRLYRLVAEQLNLSPEQHDQEVFKQILGGCQSVVVGLSALRGPLGDAHGQGQRPIKPSSRHATLAVNLAGTMAIFLIETWKHRKAMMSEPGA